LIVTAGAAQAQSGYSNAPAPNAPMPNQAQSGGPMGGCGHSATIKDEYGFRYDNEGNRLNGQGCVIAPPVSPPGTKG